jgi:1,3-beta-galactosyl-N-acetylhexosamine phosphorylase
MVHHALYQKQNYSYAGIIEILSGAPFDVSFINFDDLRENPDLLRNIDVLINIGDEGTAHGGGENWIDDDILSLIRHYIADGNGFIGVGEPSASQYQGRFFQLGDALGVELERGFTLGYDKWLWDIKPHFITEEVTDEIDFGEGKRNVYSIGADILACDVSKKHSTNPPVLNHSTVLDVQMAANSYFKGRTVYISGLPYSAENARLLHRAILWACSKDEKIFDWYSSNPNTEVHVYPDLSLYCVVNNTDFPQDTVVYIINKEPTTVSLSEAAIEWFNL